MQKEDKPKP